MKLPVLSVCCATLLIIQFCSLPRLIAAEEHSAGEPLVEQLAQSNTELTNELATIASELTRLQGERVKAEAAAVQVEADFNDARATLKTVGRVNEGLGPLLR